jgi:uncharacterized protein (TIGR01619 family)
MAEDWDIYLCEVNDKPASIFLNLALGSKAPMRDKSYLLWVWIHLRSPRADGLTDGSEFNTLSAIDKELTKRLASACKAIQAGTITTDGRREFYLYGRSIKDFDRAVTEAMAKFPQYKFDSGSKEDAQWQQYFEVLYPSDEDLQLMKNQRVLEVLEQHGDRLEPIRDVHHWIYFHTPADRSWYAIEAQELGYKIENESEIKDSVCRFGLQITRDQSVTHDQINEAVTELFRLAKQVKADYDGWETQVITIKN